MIEFSRFILENGLKVLVQEDFSTPVVAINVLYDVGSKDESPELTGLAHLFEHLMFGGSKNIKDFDTPIQQAGGECNAFTNSDITNFYITLPVENIEIAFWLESDRMKSLSFSKKSLKTQQKVVIEEFKETTLNEPYGDMWHHLSEMSYKTHPYRWPTIGLEIDHISKVTVEDIKNFFYHHYCPNNAILVVSGPVKELQIKELCEKWFSDIPMGEIPKRAFLFDKKEKEERKEIKAPVPSNAIYMAFNMPERLHPDYYTYDLISDILSNGRSARLFQKLVKENHLFSYIDAYLYGSIDPGIFIIEGRLLDEVSLEEAERAIWEELEKLKTTPIEENELQKLQNQVESTLIFSETGVQNKATNLAYFELVGDANLINTEAKLYQEVTIENIQKVANQTFRKENLSVLTYLKNLEKKN
jgi:zinc protease